MAIETMEVYGKDKGGNEVFLGTYPMSPEMKAKEIVRNCGLDPDAVFDSEADAMLGALYDMIAWMKYQGWTPPTEKVHAQAASDTRGQVELLVARREELTMRLNSLTHAPAIDSIYHGWQKELEEINTKLGSCRDAD